MADLAYGESRIVDATSESYAFEIGALIGGIPRVSTDAIAVHTGLGEDERVQYAVQRFNRGDFKQLLISGLNPQEKTAKRFDLMTLQAAPFNLARVEGVRTQVYARHTPDQAEWIALCARALGLRSISISAPAYHLPRAYLTVLAAFLKNGMHAQDCMLVPLPTPMSPYYHVPEMDVMAMEMIPGEYGRIVNYTQKGDVASAGELRKYIDSLISVMVERGLI